MPYSRVLQILDWIKSVECTKCVLIGGEPTLHPKIVSILREGNLRKIEIHLVTNGRRFSQERFCDDMLLAGLSARCVTFSMHASSRDDSSLLAGSAKYFDEFANGFNNLLHRGITPDINITISRPLLDHIDAMIEWSNSLGIKKLVFNTGMPAISQGKIDASFTLSPEELGKEVVRIFKLTSKYGISPIFLFRIPFCVLSRKDIDELLAAKVIYSGCHVQAGTAILFNVKGEIVTCNHLLDFPVYNFDEVESMVHKGKLKNLWEDEKMKNISDYARAYRSIECKTCDLWGRCKGGCSILWSHYDPFAVIKGWTPENQEYKKI